jgi:hypothetical protein
MSRYLPDDRLQDRPGAIYEIEGRQVKVVACHHGYALYLLDSAGQPGLPASDRSDRDTRLRGRL